MACTILVTLRNELGRPPIELTIDLLRAFGILTGSAVEVKKRVEEMLDAAHRYRLLDQKIGPGICLTLGKSLRES